ncbi:MAG: hypothetical protein K0R99_4061 [Microbacterium sp.]|jgi:hypothetical protein|uniref:hypothetical protein n=1 Tax=Microbacterium sp. TaxID=51671 RepID=UPI002603F768|nr:hypothetical protein [Microbacterium sp.]MDF2562615.1 hypothetical protein [Microbacterium sp.]
MANSVIIPTPASTNVRFQQVSSPRPQLVYANGVRTDEPRTNSKGEPLYGFEATVNCELLGGTVGSVRVSTPLAELPEVEFGQVLTLTDPVLTIRNNRDGFDLSISIEASGIAETQPAQGRRPNSSDA